MRGRKYSITGQRACAASAPETILGVTSTTAIRPQIYEMLLGSSATPADNALLWYVQRNTAAGTSTAVTPTAMDSGDPASTATAGKNHTVDPTFTANLYLFYLALNQRASHRWIADTEGALVIPATANNGAGLWLTHASFTGNCDASLYFQE